MGKVIADEDSCEEVAVKLAVSYGGTFNAPDLPPEWKYDDLPAGCFWTGSSVYFNFNVDPSSTFPSKGPSWQDNHAGICIPPGIYVNYLLV